MQARIKIVKRATRMPTDCAPIPIVKSDRQRQRENADVVKGWVSDWQVRKRHLQAAAQTLVAQCVLAAREKNRFRGELNALVTRPEAL